MATWLIVPNLDEGLAQLNKRFPKRAKKAEGGIGDQAHATGTSSHNPDKSGKPEWKDGDDKNEVRARDFDKNLNDPDYAMEQVVQLWVKKCRSGEMWWVRYIIYAGRIWHKRDGFKTHEYTGSNKHFDHAHVNSDFTQKADGATGTNWYLVELKPKAAKPPVTTPSAPGKPATPVLKPLANVKVDGRLGPETIKLWQKVMKTPVDGVIDKKDSELIRAVQRKLRVTDHRLEEDGEFGPQTIRRLQSYLKSPVDGFISDGYSQVIVALQRRLNADWF